MASRPLPALQPLRQKLLATWSGLGARERLLVGGAAAVVGLALLWWLGLSPALKTLRQAPALHSQLDTQLTQMRALAASAENLRSQNNVQALAPESARRALEQAMAALGDSAQLALQGDRATVTLRGTAPQALAQWLAQVRINARVVPVQADLQQAGDGTGWNGQLVLAGPGLGTGN